MVTHSVHQVGFTQTNTAIKEERVVTVLGIVCHLPGRCAGQLVGLAFHEVFEGERAIQVTGVLERTFHLHSALLGTHRGLLRTRTGHRVETVTRWLFTDVGNFLCRTLGRRSRRGRCRSTDRCLRRLCLGRGSSQWRIRSGTRRRTAFAAY